MFSPSGARLSACAAAPNTNGWPSGDCSGLSRIPTSVLIGDSGQRDALTYEEMAREFPG